MAMNGEELIAMPTSVSVMAPSDMPGGYEFYADAGNGSSYKVRVPDGGAKAGDRFDAVIVHDASAATSSGGGGHNIPTGRWRDGLCDCFTLGICHSVCCLGYWCTSCLLGQVLSRNRLSWMGSPNAAYKIDPCSYQFWFVVAIIGLVVHAGMEVQYSVGEYAVPTDEFGNEIAPATLEYTGPAWASTLGSVCSIISMVLGILSCVTTCRAREHLRHKYQIEPETCGSCEDCCCAWWCAPCSTCQMARHTADYNHYPPSCCTATGLNPNAPEVV